ncbi:hypothetical protein ZWY2020_056392 [Hordeum vulgare]|nr:hypothetical protein ZWY2020_056392 [Hordeum vulgare]
MTVTTVAANVDWLKVELGQAKQEGAEQRAEAIEERDIRTKSEARVSKVQQELKEAITKNEALEQKEREKSTELTSVTAALQEAWKEAHDLRKEVHQIKKIAVGKRYLLQRTFVGQRFVSLNRIWISPSVIVGLPNSATEAEKYCASQKDGAQHRLFWAQFQNLEHPQLASDQLKQPMELHKMTKPAMKDLCIRLWPTKPFPNNYFGLFQKLIDVSPGIDILKSSVCIEGACMAFAKTMTHLPKLEPMKMAITPPPPGKEHTRPEQYFDTAMEGARAIEALCTKDIALY